MYYYNALVCVGWYWLCACCIAAIYILTDILIIKINSSILIFKLFSKEPSKILIPYNREQLDAFQMFDDDWQIAIGNYCDQILHLLPSRFVNSKIKKGEFKYSFSSIRFYNMFSS